MGAETTPSEIPPRTPAKTVKTLAIAAGGIITAAGAIFGIVAVVHQVQKDAESSVSLEATGERRKVTYPPVVEAERQEVFKLSAESYPAPIKGLELGECKIEGYGKRDKIERVDCPKDPLRKWFDDRRYERPVWLSFTENVTVTIKNVGTKHLVKGRLKAPGLAGEYYVEKRVSVRKFDREIELPQLDAGESLIVHWWAGSSPTDSSADGPVRIWLPDGGDAKVEFPDEKAEYSFWWWLFWFLLVPVVVIIGGIASHGYAFNKGVSVQYEYSRAQAAARKTEAAKAAATAATADPFPGPVPAPASPEPCPVESGEPAK